MEIINDLWPSGVGLLLLIGINVVLGSCDAWLSGEFDRTVFLKGLIKGALIAVCLILAYVAGYINPSIYITVNGEAVTLASAVTLVMIAAYTAYSIKVLKKMYELFNLDTSNLTLAANSNNEDTATNTATEAATETTEG